MSSKASIQTHTLIPPRALLPVPANSRSSSSSSSYSDRRTSTLPLSLKTSEPIAERADQSRVLQFDSSKVESPFLDEAVLLRMRRDADADAAAAKAMKDGRGT